jgi:hypothetical protein
MTHFALDFGLTHYQRARYLHITHLKLQNFYWDVDVDSLESIFPNLKSIRFSVSRSSFPDGPVTIPLSCQSMCVCDVFDEEVLGDFLKLVRAPSIKNLMFSGQGGLDPKNGCQEALPAQAFIDFVEDSGCTLEIFALKDMYLRKTQFDAVVDALHMPGVEPQWVSYPGLVGFDVFRMFRMGEFEGREILRAAFE